MYGNDKKILTSAIATFGVDNQLERLVEECLEAGQQALHVKKGKEGAEDKLIEELVDVAILTEQMKLLYGEERFNHYYKLKMERLQKRIQAGDQNKE